MIVKFTNNNNNLKNWKFLQTLKIIYSIKHAKLEKKKFYLLCKMWKLKLKNNLFA